MLPLASSLLMAAAIYTMNMAYGYFVESRSRRQIEGRFGEYAPGRPSSRFSFRTSGDSPASRKR